MTPVHHEQNGRIVWHCDGCGGALGPDAPGYLEVDAALAEKQALEADQRAHERYNRAETEGIAAYVWTGDELLALPPRVSWRAWHLKCDPNPDESGYWMDSHRCDTVGKMLHWAAHLGTKPWISQTDWWDLCREIGTDA